VENSGSFFIGAWTVGVGAALLSVVEFIAVSVFARWAFSLGPIIRREKRPFPPVSATLIGRVVRTQSGAFKITDSYVCLFRARTWLIGGTTPFPVRGSVRWHDGNATIQSRVPLFTCVVFVAWIVGWTTAVVGMLFQGSGVVFSLCFGLAGWAFAAAMVYFSLRAELRHADRVLAELAGLLDHYRAQGS
jgi:hypothetical protein